MDENLWKLVIPIAAGCGFIGYGAYAFWKEEFNLSLGDGPNDPPDHVFRGAGAKLAGVLTMALGVGVMAFFLWRFFKLG